MTLTTTTTFAGEWVCITNSLTRTRKSNRDYFQEKIINTHTHTNGNLMTLFPKDNRFSRSAKSTDNVVNTDHYRKKDTDC